jgi:XTP/dITP diphosphohydrolase
LVIASGNAGKIMEFQRLLADLPVQVLPQPPGIEVEESGDSFAANARIKAEAAALSTGHWALADDSGLAVAALHGAPGIHSARYAENDGLRIERLVRELAAALQHQPQQDRRGRFVAALALANPNGRTVLEVEGYCEGEILEQPRGEGGFGYDPLFLVPELGLSFAEMEPGLKQRLGHRGKAMALLIPQLRNLLAT